MVTVAKRFRRKNHNIQQIQESMKQWSKWQIQVERMEKTVETQKNDFVWGQQDQQQQWDVMQQHMKNWNEKNHKEWVLKGKEIYEARLTATGSAK